MLRKGDLVKWCDPRPVSYRGSSDKPVLGIILEDEEESKLIMVYFPDDGPYNGDREPVRWLQLVSRANQG